MTAESAQPCERCGRSFHCGANAGSCWCASLVLPEGLHSTLATAYDRCLCPTCLEELATGQRPDRPGA